MQNIQLELLISAVSLQPYFFTERAPVHSLHCADIPRPSHQKLHFSLGFIGESSLQLNALANSGVFFRGMLHLTLKSG